MLCCVLNVSYICYMNYLEPLVTLIVGLFAIYLYIKQRRDHKRDAASILLLEIKSAERKIKSAKNKKPESIDLSDEIPLVKSENWSRYKYLFVKDFDRDDWDALNDFYEKCAAYDDAIVSGSLSFSKNEEQIRVNAHRIFADYIKEAIDGIKGNDNPQAALEPYKLKAQVFDKMYLDANPDFLKPMYSPQKYLDDRNRLLALIDANLSSGQVGRTLKKIAKIKP
jgi:hypothetical protein